MIYLMLISIFFLVNFLEQTTSESFLVIPLPALGFVTLAQVLLIFLLIIIALRSINLRDYIGTYNCDFSVKYLRISLYSILCMILFQAFRGLLDGTGVWWVAQSMRFLMYYAYFICLIYGIHNNLELNRFIRAIIIISVIISLLNIVQSLMGVDLVGNKVVVTSDGFVRTYSSGQRLQLLTICILMGTLFERQTIIKRPLILLIIICGGLLTSYSRSHYIMALFGLLSVGIIYFSFFRHHMRFVFIFLILIGILFEGNIISGELVGDRIVSSYDDIYSTDSSKGTFAGRDYLWKSRYEAVLETNPAFGVGYIVKSYSEIATDVGLQITNDNGFANIIVTFGIVGLVLFINLIVAAFISGILMLRSCTDIYHRFVVVGITVYQILTIGLSYVADNFFYGPGIIVLCTTWALYILINQYGIKKRGK